MRKNTNRYEKTFVLMFLPFYCLFFLFLSFEEQRILLNFWYFLLKQKHPLLSLIFCETSNSYEFEVSQNIKDNNDCFCFKKKISKVLPLLLLYLWAKYEPIWLNFTVKTLIFSKLKIAYCSSKSVGTDNHCFACKILPYWLIFCPQVEEK